MLLSLQLKKVREQNVFIFTVYIHVYNLTNLEAMIKKHDKYFTYFDFDWSDSFYFLVAF